MNSVAATILGPPVPRLPGRQWTAIGKEFRMLLTSIKTCEFVVGETIIQFGPAGFWSQVFRDVQTAGAEAKMPG